VKIAVMANRTWSEIQPQEFVLAFIAAVVGVLLLPLGEWKRGNGVLKTLRIANHPVVVPLG
jgi:hypothetical protein